MIQQTLFGEKKKSELFLKTCYTDEGMCYYCMPKQCPDNFNNGSCLYRPVFKKLGRERVNVGVNIPEKVHDCPCLKDTGKIPMINWKGC